MPLNLPLNPTIHKLKKGSHPDKPATKGTTTATNKKQATIDLDADPTHALVLWEQDNKMTIVPVSHVMNKTNKPLSEESDYLTKWNTKHLLAKIITLGSHVDCKRILDIKQANFEPVKKSVKQTVVEQTIDETLINSDENAILKLNLVEMSKSLVERDAEALRLNGVIDEKNKQIQTFQKAFRKLNSFL
jgi:hypothetical protein